MKPKFYLPTMFDNIANWKTGKFEAQHIFQDYLDNTKNGRARFKAFITYYNPNRNYDVLAKIGDILYETK